jgi:hypothetical protein
MRRTGNCGSYSKNVQAASSHDSGAPQQKQNETHLLPRRNEVTRIPQIGQSYRGSWPFVGRIDLEITDLNNVYLERELLRVENWGAATLGSTPEPTNHCSKRPRSVPRAITLANITIPHRIAANFTGCQPDPDDPECATLSRQCHERIG